MQKLRKALVISVMAFTVLSMSVVVAPKADAAAVAGDLIKMDGLSSVYFLAADGKRYVFPNESTYFSWYSDFSGVVTIPQSELETYPLGKNVTVRPGTKLVKITTDPKVYAVEPNGILKHVPSEATAITLWGADWAKRVIDISDAFFTNYTIGSGQVSATAYPAGSLVKFGTSPDVFYIAADGKAQKITSESAFLANRFKWSDVITATIAAPTAGADITAGVTALTDTSSGAGGAAGAGTGLTVAISSDTPASASVPKNGARVPMAKVNLTASNDGVITVNSITVKRIGLSNSTQIGNVWAEKDGTVIASKKDVNSNDEAILTFSPALSINAGNTVTIDLIASLVAATGNIGISIQTASAIATNGAVVSGSFPVRGNLMAPIDYDVVNLYLTGTSSATYSLRVGDEQVELGKFEVAFSSTVAAKDVTIQSIMLKNNGVEDLSATVMNLYLEYNGDKVSENATINGRFVTFTFPGGGLPLLKDDSSKVLYIKGDIIGKENTGTNSLTLQLNKSTDFVAFEQATGFGVNVYNTSGGTNAADNFAISNSTIAAGVITISKKSTSPADTTIVKGTDNTVLIANFRADEAINADGLVLTYGSNASNATTSDQFENVRVFVNGTLVDSFDPAKDTSAPKTIALNSSITLNKGDNEVKVMVKAKTTAAANSAFMAILDGDVILDNQNAEYVSSGNAVDTTDISGSATGGIFTVATAIMTTVRNDGYSLMRPVVKGSLDVSLGKFVLKATNDDIKVTSIAFGQNASTTAHSSIYDAKIFKDGVQIGTTKDFGSSGVTFSNLNFVIEKDKSANIEFKASFDSSATGGFKSTMTVNAQDVSRGTSISQGNTAVSQEFQLKSTGSLTVALGGDTPVSTVLAAVATEQEIAQYKFTAVDDAATLTKITFANATSVTPVIPVTDADSLVSELRLYDGTTLIDSTQLVQGIGEFNVNSKVVVAANSNKTLSVKVVLNPISNDANATNKDLQFLLKNVEFKSSDGTLNQPTADNKLASTFRIRKTIPTVTLQALPDTTLGAGDMVVSKFTVTANASGDVTLSQVVLTYATSSANVTVENMDSNAITVNGTTKDFASTVDTAAKTITVDFSSSPEVISAGTSKTFEIKVQLGVSGSDTESITTKILEDANYTVGATSKFIWSDGASISGLTNSTGFNVPGLPTNTQRLSN